MFSTVDNSLKMNFDDVKIKNFDLNSNLRVTSQENSKEEQGILGTTLNSSSTTSKKLSVGAQKVVQEPDQLHRPPLEEEEKEEE